VETLLVNEKNISLIMPDIQETIGFLLVKKPFSGKRSLKIKQMKKLIVALIFSSLLVFERSVTNSPAD